MTIQVLSQAQIYEMAGLRPVPNAYQPATVGRKGMIRAVNKPFSENLRRVSFRTPGELRKQMPEQVYYTNPTISYTKKNRDGTSMDYNRTDGRFRAIIGENTQRVYAIMSNRYEPTQHSTVLEAMAQASEDTGIRIFGNIRGDKQSITQGIMNAHCIFASPDYHAYFERNEKDPYMLGIRAFNSHTGLTKFGAEIFGVRMICSNYNVFGRSLGYIGWKHFVKEEDIASGFAGVLKYYMNEIPALANLISEADNEILNITEAEAVLWGISLQPNNIDGIIDNIETLNPEIKDLSRITTYDLYNAATAYLSYRSAGGNMINGTIELAHKIERILTDKTGDLLETGFERKRRWEEMQKTKTIKVTADDISIVDAEWD
ncbi:MAG: hypothetical protein FWG41_06305 [Methanomassiliicoccaceae archaeon]|nr:hypothetical protein [Methanomassiliicoccaceae archaeon]